MATERPPPPALSSISPSCFAETPFFAKHDGLMDERAGGGGRSVAISHPHKLLP